MAKKSKVRRADHRLVDAHPHINDFSIEGSSSIAEADGSDCVVLCIVLAPDIRPSDKCDPRVDPVVAEGVRSSGSPTCSAHACAQHPALTTCS